VDGIPEELLKCAIGPVSAARNNVDVIVHYIETMFWISADDLGDDHA